MKHSQRTANCPSPARKQMFSTAYLYLPAPFHLSLHRSLRALPRQGFHRFFFSPFHVENLARIRIYTITIITSRLQSLAQLLVFAVSAISQKERERESFPPSDRSYVRATYIHSRQKSTCANESLRNDVENR